MYTELLRGEENGKGRSMFDTTSGNGLKSRGEVFGCQLVWVKELNQLEAKVTNPVKQRKGAPPTIMDSSKSHRDRQQRQTHKLLQVSPGKQIIRCFF